MHSSTIAVIAASLILGTSSVAMAKKPKVAVLGLEVVEEMDAKIAKFATDLTDALRDRAKVGAGPFKLAPNSQKDLLEMKLISGCSNEARACMADIGKFLKSERLIYGKIEQRKNGYQVTLKLLNVGSEKLERSTTEIIALDDIAPARINEWARRLYNRLTGVPEQGVLTITANVETGTVYVNDEVKGSLVDGKASIDGLPEGTLEVRVESEGHATYSTEVKMKGGEPTELETNLASLGAVGGGGGKKAGRPGGTSRVLFWTTAVLAVGSAGGATWMGLQVGPLEDDKEAAIREYQASSGMMLDQGDACADAKAKGVPSVSEICEEGKDKALYTEILMGAAGVSAAAAMFFFYKGYIAPKSPSSTETAGRATKRGSAVVFTPTVTPSYMGAGVRIDF